MKTEKVKIKHVVVGRDEIFYFSRKLDALYCLKTIIDATSGHNISFEDLCVDLVGRAYDKYTAWYTKKDFCPRYYTIADYITSLENLDDEVQDARLLALYKRLLGYEFRCVNEF